MLQISGIHSTRLLSQIGLKRDRIVNLIGQLIKHSQLQDHWLNLYFVNPIEIRQYSKDYKGIDRYCDVLAFPTDKDLLLPHDGGAQFLGSIIICLPFVMRRLVQKRCYSTEMAKLRIFRLLIHSYCHLLGYDHLDRKEAALMGRKEKFLASKTLHALL